VAYTLDRLGQAAVALGQPTRGVTLAGAASRLREAVGGGLTVEQLRWKLEDPRDGARRVLTEAEVDVAWARGRVMTPEQAVVHAKEPALEPPAADNVTGTRIGTLPGDAGEITSR
jgi:hypothetical protein